MPTTPAGCLVFAYITAERNVFVLWALKQTDPTVCTFWCNGLDCLHICARSFLDMSLKYSGRHCIRTTVQTQQQLELLMCK